MNGITKQLQMLELHPREIHVWFACPDEIQDITLLSAYQKLLTPEEQIQQHRFYFAKHQHQYLITRALVRTMLSRYIGIAPQEWRFSQNQYGRPEVITTAGMPPLRFNLSHTEGLIMCGVVLQQDIGVDVETVERKGATVEIADRFFSLQEVNDLSLVPEREKRHRFFQYWTLKESYIKARGMGLFLPLEHFSFHLSNNEPLRISFNAQLHDDPERWQFWLLKPTSHHYAAISIYREKNRDYQLVNRKVIPLMEEHDFCCPLVNQS